MFRVIAAVMLGYFIMALFVSISFLAAYVVMGAERVFQPGSYEVTSLWLVTSMGLGLLAALLGGIVCAAVAHHSKAPAVLAGLILMLGLVMAIWAFRFETGRPPLERDQNVGYRDAKRYAEQPSWVAVANPLIRAAGVVLGGTLWSLPKRTKQRGKDEGRR